MARKTKKKTAKKRRPSKPKLLSGGNPQFAKAGGDAPVQADIAAMPGWKSDVGRRLDALIERTVPGVRGEVELPFLRRRGPELVPRLPHFHELREGGFFRGTSLNPMPPGASKHKEVRYLDIRTVDEFDEAQIAAWIRPAAALPGWVP